MDLRATIAKRYLVSRKRFSMITVITGVSICGVALGVASLIVVLSVMNGFYDFVREMLVSIDPHVRIEAAAGRPDITNADSLAALVLTIPAVEGVSAVVEGKALLLGEGQKINKVVVVRGVDQASIGEVSSVADKVRFGEFNLSRNGRPPGVVIGSALGRRFGIFPGTGGVDADKVSLVSAQVLERTITSVIGTPPFTRFEVRGLFELQSIYDESHVFVDLPEAQRLFKMGNSVSAVELKLGNIEDAEEVKKILGRMLPAEMYEVKTWYDLQKSLYDVMKLEKWGASIILALIVLVAAFNIIGSLTMVVIEKRKDIGILKSMGFKQRDIRGIFLLEGLFIGVLGVVAGVIIGLGLSLAQQYFELVPLAEQESFLINAYPIAIQPFDVVLVAIVSILLCTLASIYPAFRASSLQPAEAVRGLG